MDTDTISDQRHKVSADPFWPGGPRPSSDEAMARAAQDGLEMAVALARAGDSQRARKICASVFFEAQPTIATREDLLRATMYALLLAGGFKLLGRVIMAVSGRYVQVVVLPQGSEPVMPPRTWQETRRTICALDPRWLARLSHDDVSLRRWCETLIAQRDSRPDPVETVPSILHLEPG